MKRKNLPLLAGLALCIAPTLAVAQVSIGDGPWDTNGNDIYNANNGFVGINTKTPNSRLHVKGRLTSQGDIKMSGETHSIIFPETYGTPDPMVFMYDSGNSNSTRMVLAHSPALPDWGLEYSDISDEFMFVQGGAPIFRVGNDVTVHQNMTVHQGIQLSGGLSWWALSFMSPQDSIVFPATSGINEPMIQMFASGTQNADRMVLAHSPNYEDWGLEYSDPGDEFRFVRQGTTVMNVDLGSNRVAIGSSSTTGGSTLQVGDAGDGSYAIANSWALFSSRDYKKDIERLDQNDCQELLDEVVATPVFKFRYKGEPEEKSQRLGLIVEESPEQVLSPETKGVDLGRYVTALHAAVKAQQELLEAQAAEVEALRQQLEALRGDA